MTSPPPTPPTGFRPRHLAVSAAITALILALLIAEWRRTSPEREATRTYTDMIALANQGNLEGLRKLSTRQYRTQHPFRPADEGGVIGLPRIPPHPNYKVWRDGAEVRLCPFNRSGPVYRFVREGNGWKYDGPAGLLRPDGQFVPGGWAVPGASGR